MPIKSIRQRLGIFFVVVFRKMSAVFMILFLLVRVRDSVGEPKVSEVRVLTSTKANLFVE